MNYNENLLRQIRPESTFDNYRVYHPGQQKVVDMLRSLAQQIVDNADFIDGNEYPFQYGQWISLYSEPGHGKSHLLESFARHIMDNAPRLASSIFLSRTDFTLLHITGTFLYGRCPIVLIDDLFSTSQSLSDLHPVTDLKRMMEFIASVYERRTLVITTSNFPMMGIVGRMREVDKIGRTISRCHEIFSTAGEIYIPGHDYRQDIAAARRAGRGVIRFPF